MPSKEKPQPPKSITAPPTFQDAEQRTWQIKLTGELIDSVLATTQIDLVPDDQDYGPVITLITSHRKLGAVLWECVKKQAESDSIDKAAFTAALDGPAYAKGWEALVDAIHFFIQNLSPKRAESFEAMVEATMKVVEAEAQTQIEIILSQSTDEALKDAATKIKEQMQTELVKEFANCAASSPGSSASTRGRSR
jgi:hypothetical protein